MSVAMTKDEREAFLAGLHVGVISVAQGERAPLTIPIWYSYTPGGDVTILTGRGSRKAVLITQAATFSLCVQDEAPPYKYVAVEGPVVGIESADRERDTRAMARRYLGVAGGDRFLAQTAANATGESDDVVIRMHPERWLTADYGKAGG
jgi:nitroimidazol reductase NimA-like FMN-containing flavoprotein (pyridoxamine 5'-phosphate oxidase superfamily)